MKLPNVMTLGDIRDRLRELVEAGAHPGAIDWVLHHHIDWPEGHVTGNHAEDRHPDTAQALALYRVVEAIKETGGVVEINGVRIEPCDEYGLTESQRNALRAAPEGI